MLDPHHLVCPRDKQTFYLADTGPSQLSADGYFGLGILPGDREFVPRRLRPVLSASELLPKASLHFAPLLLVADSIYLSARKKTRRHWDVAA